MKISPIMMNSKETLPQSSSRNQTLPYETTTTINNSTDTFQKGISFKSRYFIKFPSGGYKAEEVDIVKKLLSKGISTSSNDDVKSIIVEELIQNFKKLPFSERYKRTCGFMETEGGIIRGITAFCTLGVSEVLNAADKAIITKAREKEMPSWQWNWISERALDLKNGLMKDLEAGHKGQPFVED